MLSVYSSTLDGLDEEQQVMQVGGDAPWSVAEVTCFIVIFTMDLMFTTLECLFLTEIDLQPLQMSMTDCNLGPRLATRRDACCVNLLPIIPDEGR